MVDLKGKAQQDPSTFDGDMILRPAPVALVVGGGVVAERVRSAVMDLGGIARVLERSDELGVELSDAALNVVVVDLGEDRPEILQKVQKERPDVPVIAIANDASLESAVSAMREGAADVIEGPISPGALRRALERQPCRDASRIDREYDERIDTARRQILARAFDVANAQLQRALSLDARRPEAFNLLGVLDEVRGHRLKAQGWWRMALVADPSYQPARHNLARSTRRPAPPGPLSLE